jgi:2,4-dienoyl-CoA reductase-like NADH-dependent reductase (Old Yellow Enzyme family)
VPGFGLETIEAVRAAWPDELPLLLRISATGPPLQLVTNSKGA